MTSNNALELEFIPGNGSAVTFAGTEWTPAGLANYKKHQAIEK